MVCPFVKAKEQRIKKKVIITNANAMGFIHLNAHPGLVMNLYITFNLVSIHFLKFFN